MTAFGLFLLAVSLSHAQEKIRTLEHGKYRKYDTRTEPIAIVSREVGDKPFIDDTKVVGSPDWLRHLTLEVKNISDKTINSFQIHLVIPKQGGMQYDWVMRMMFPFPRDKSGLNKNSQGVTEQDGGNILEPGATIKLRISENQLRVLDEIRKYGVMDVERVSVSFDKVDFGDGTRWDRGVEMKEDPTQPGRYLPVGSDRPGGYQTFSKWFRPFAFINAVGYPMGQFVTNLPAKCRFSFAAGSNTVSAALPTPTGCGWRTGTYSTFCATAAEGNCTAPLGTRKYDSVEIS